MYELVRAEEDHCEALHTSFHIQITSCVKYHAHNQLPRNLSFLNLFLYFLFFSGKITNKVLTVLLSKIQCFLLSVICYILYGLFSLVFVRGELSTVSNNTWYTTDSSRHVSQGAGGGAGGGGGGENVIQLLLPTTPQSSSVLSSNPPVAFITQSSIIIPYTMSSTFVDLSYSLLSLYPIIFCSTPHVA